MGFSLIDNIKTSCRAVAEKATRVRINYEFIPAYASSLPLNKALPPVLDPDSHFLGHGGDTVAFILTLDAINFGSGYFPHLHKRPGMSGYFTVASSLTDYFKKHGPFSAAQLGNITIKNCARIFKQNLNNQPVRELMQLFTEALKDLGQYLTTGFCGSFMKLVESADSSADRLVALLVKMPFFNDVESYTDFDVSFYKRAQLTAADLSLAFNGKGPGHFSDLEQLTIFADNLIPHVLRVDQILFYEKTLANRIDAGQLIAAGSAEEIEIRACAVHAVEGMKAELRKTGHKVASAELDYLLWNRGRQPYYKAIPRHRTRTVFY